MATATKNKPSGLTLDGIKQTVKQRMDELAPAAAEFAEATTVWEALSGSVDAGSTVLPDRVAKRLSARPAQRQTAKRAGNRRGRPAGSGKRSAQVIALLTDKPGQTTTELAQAMAIKPNYLYRVLPDMVKAGTLVKNGSEFSVT
jgi:hypothetical protein